MRLPRLRRADLDGAQAVLFDEIAGGRRASGPQALPLVGPDGALEGPFNAMLTSPAIGLPLQALGAALRYRSSLPDRTRELVILRVAAEWDSPFERYAHEAVGRRCGLTEDELAAVRGGRIPAGLADDERELLELADILCRTRTGSPPDRFAALDTGVVFEVTTLVGYYAMLALQLRVFEVDGPSSQDRS
jgi:4-carboxymuconolactone decarboxylase